jgi:hypothetical protein
MMKILNRREVKGQHAEDGILAQGYRCKLFTCSTWLRIQTVVKMGMGKCVSIMQGNRLRLLKITNEASKKEV